MALENYARNAVEDTLQDVALQVGLIGYRSAVACQDLLKGGQLSIGKYRKGILKVILKSSEGIATLCK